MTGEAGERDSGNTTQAGPGFSAVYVRLHRSGRAVTAQRDICGITRHV